MLFTEKEIIIVERYGNTYRQIHKKKINNANVDRYEYNDKVYHLSLPSFYRKSKYLNRDIAVYVFEKDNPIPLSFNEQTNEINAKLLRSLLKTEIRIKKIEDEKSLLEKIDLKLMLAGFAAVIVLLFIFNSINHTDANVNTASTNTTKETNTNVDSLNVIHQNQHNLTITHNLTNNKTEVVV